MESTVDEARINPVSSVVSGTENELKGGEKPLLTTARESCLRTAWKKDRGGASNDDAALVEHDPDSIDAK
jgi:hypothetical protein